MDRDTLVTAIQRETDPERARLLLDLFKTLEDSERARLDEASARREFWRNPVLIAVSGGAVSLLTGVVLSFVEHSNSIRLEREQLALEMLREAVVEDRARTLNNLQFLFDAGLLGEFGEDVVNSAELHQPVAAGPTAGRQQGEAARRGVVSPEPEASVAMPPPPPSSPAPPAEATEPAAVGGQRVLQTSAHRDEATAQAFLAENLGDVPGAWIMKRGETWSTVIPLVADARVTRIVAELPDYVRQQGPYIRRLDVDCAGMVPLEGSGPAAVRECRLPETQER